MSGVGWTATRCVGQPRGGNPDAGNTPITGIHGPPVGRGGKRNNPGGGAPTTLVLDTFTDSFGTAINLHTPDTDTVGSGWVIYTSAPAIAGGNDLWNPGAGGMCGIDSGQADVTVYADITYPGAGHGDGGITGRIADASNYWRCEIADSTLANPVLHIYQYAGGVPTSRANVTCTGLGPMQSTEHKMTLSFANNTITASIGAFSCDHVSATHKTETVHGVHTSLATTTLDNFNIETP